MQHWARGAIDEALETTGQPFGRLLNDLDRIVGLIENMEWHRFRTDALENVLGQIAECSDNDDLTPLLLSAATELGFQHATVFVLRQGSGAVFSQRVCTCYPMSWVQRYQEKGYQSIDPVIARALASDEPFLFSELSDSVPMIKAFWSDAEAHGIGSSGLCCAFELGGSTRIGVSYSSSVSEAQFRDIVALNGHDAIVAARLMAETFCGLAGKGRNNNCPLTTAELRFLHLLLVVDDPADALKHMTGIRSKELLQFSICAKLGVKSLLQAISIASANRWFDELPYDMQEVSRVMPEISDLDGPGRTCGGRSETIGGPEFDRPLNLHRQTAQRWPEGIG